MNRNKRRRLPDKAFGYWAKRGIALPIPPDIAAELIAMFPRCARDGFALAVSYVPLWSRIELSTYDIPGRNYYELRLKLVPPGANLLGPADPHTQEWPYNLFRWLEPWQGIFRSLPLRILRPFIRAEFELIIRSKESSLRIPDLHQDAVEEALYEANVMMDKLMRRFVPARHYRSCLDTYFTYYLYLWETAGCFDRDGVLDAERAALRACTDNRKLRRWLEYGQR
jgi:hypothetical protein